MTEIRPTLLIALGGNLPSRWGDPAQTLEGAIKFLSRRGLEITSVSRFFNTPCFPAGSGPDYVNAALVAFSDMDRHQVLDLLHEAEHHFGRRRVERWGRRTLDLDLIAVGQDIYPDRASFEHWCGLPLSDQMEHTPKHLILPHPRLQDRAFVLVPLAEIAPDWRHPVSGRSISEMCSALPEEVHREIVPI